MKDLAVQAHLQSDNPYKHIPQVLDAYTLFLKTVKKHPEMMREVHESNLSFQDQCETAATRLVSQGLGIAIELPQTEGSSRAGSSALGASENNSLAPSPDLEPQQYVDAQTHQRLDQKVSLLEQRVNRIDLFEGGMQQVFTQTQVLALEGGASQAESNRGLQDVRVDRLAAVVRDLGQDQQAIIQDVLEVRAAQERTELRVHDLERNPRRLNCNSLSSSSRRSSSGSNTLGRTQMELNRLPRDWMQAQFSLPNMTEISADYLRNHDQAKHDHD